MSGLSVLLGLIIVFAIDEISDPMVGMLLAFGGGVYLQIGASECMPRVYAGVEASVASRLYCIAAYVLGALAIGLVLLDHKHCSTGGMGMHTDTLLPKGAVPPSILPMGTRDRHRSVRSRSGGRPLLLRACPCGLAR